jgi:DNA-binding transcriptional ArsR family regulator
LKGAEQRRAMGRAAAVEIRHAILGVLGERRAATAKEIQSDVGLPRSTVNDHLRQLCEDGLIECIEMNPTRGTFERVFAPAAAALYADDDDLESMDPKEQRQVKFGQLRSALSDASLAFSGAIRTHLRGEVFSAARAQVDAEGWSELTAIHTRAIQEMDRVREESAKRLRENGAASIRASSGIFLFELPPTSAPG